MKRYLDRITTSKMFLGVIAALLLYALAGFALAPALLERYLPRYAEEQLGSQVTVGDVRINPFLLRLEVKGFRLEYPPGQPLVRFGRLLVDFQLSSLFRRAWTFADVQIDGLDLNEVQRDGGLNLAAFMDRLAQRYVAVSSGERPLDGGSCSTPSSEMKLTFSDLSGQTPLTTTFVPINLEVLNLATLPDRHGRYAITAAVPDGGTITWQGDVSLLPTASAGKLEVKGVKLATVWAFVRDELRLAEPRKRRSRHALPLRVRESPGDARAGRYPRPGLRAGAPRAAAVIRSSRWTRSRRAARDSISRVASSSCRASSWPAGAWP